MGPYKNVVTRFEPPLQLTWHEESPRSMQQQEGNYVLERDGAGTKMTIDLNYVTNGLRGAVMSPVLSLMAPSLGRRLLRQLKAALEQEPAD